jgi:hypothetical protein
MILSPFLAVMLASWTTLVAAQEPQGPFVYDTIHNKTSLTGTWSSGSKAVVTGSGFANPANMSFTYPKVTGISFSFTDDNHYEVARYRFNSNASEPNCITGVVLWAHGKVTFNSNDGSLVLTPLGDGYQQIQDPCAAVSNFVEIYNETETMKDWRIYQDPTDGFKLHLFQFDGAPLAPMFQVSTNPIMLPTRLLRNVTQPTEVLGKRSGGAPPTASWSVSTHLGVAGLLGAVALLL